MTRFIVDSHLHIWSDDPSRYPWHPISGATPPTVEGSAEWLVALMRRHKVAVAIAVQSRVYGYDHSYLADSVREYADRIVGVGFVDLTRPINAQVSALAAQGFRGLRVDLLGMGQVDGDTVDLLWIAAADAGMPIELLVGSDQLQMIRPIVERVPEVPVIIEHMGLWGDRSTNGVLPVLDLSPLPNVFVKLTLADVSAEGPPFRDLHSSVASLRDAFGASRLMWGSDMPWRGEGTYQATLDAVAVRMPFLTDSEIRWILGDTARGVWRIETPQR